MLSRINQCLVRNMNRHCVKFIFAILFYCNFAGNGIQWIRADSPTGLNETPIVSTDLGQIRGNVLESRLGNLFYSFRGIRYAQPPVNELRFEVSTMKMT